MFLLSKSGLTYYHGKIKNLLANKVDKETGKGLSTNDFTAAEKAKLADVIADPSTMTAEQKAAWRTALGIDDLQEKPVNRLLFGRDIPFAQGGYEIYASLDYVDEFSASVLRIKFIGENTTGNPVIYTVGSVNVTDESIICGTYYLNNQTDPSLFKMQVNVYGTWEDLDPAQPYKYYDIVGRKTVQFRIVATAAEYVTNIVFCPYLKNAKFGVGYVNPAAPLDYLYTYKSSMVSASTGIKMVQNQPNTTIRISTQ